ncbi:ABC transporter permease [Amycolatopsis dendrobii]|uniref:FtsX-like permease family protein n=1 Tax=Amycolatopsis dendrobii TaxID=2760662 RepID=A0A7W3W1D9_9PSEU|nr:ABC transporter permease [Amycolatopsis dendrobii]MBB1156542.1 FtsX-like permease family protein [Amycolatopsis dendrobii]
MFELAVKTLRGRASGFAGAFVALLGAATLVTAFGILLQSGAETGVAPQRYAGVPVVAGGAKSFEVRENGKTKSKPLKEPAPLSRETVRKIAGTDGVGSVVPDVSFPAVLGDMAAAGHPWSSARLGPFDLVAGREPQRPGEVVLDAGPGWEAGAAVRIQTTEAAAEYRVVGVAKLSEADGDLRAPVAFFADAEAESLAGRGDRVDAVGVFPRPGVDPGDLADRLTAALGSEAEVTTGDDRSRIENPDVASASSTLREIAGSLGGTVLLIAILVVASTLALSVHQRRRELAVLRAIAATPRQIWKMLAAEALVLSVVASAIGCLPGILAAQLLRGALVLIGVVPEDFSFSVGILPMLVAVLAGVATAQIATFAVAWKASSVRPVEALSDAAVEQPGISGGRRTLGVLLLLLGFAASLLPVFFSGVFAVAGAGSGGLVMIVAVLLLAPPIAAFATRLLAKPITRRFKEYGCLAAANTRANAHRLAAGIGPLVLAIGFACVQLFIPTTLAAAAADQADEGIIAQYTLTGAAGGLPDDAVRDAAALPGAEAATGVTRVPVFASTKVLDSPEIFDFPAQGITVDNAAKTMDLAVSSGNLADLAPGKVALSASAASTLGVKVGDRIKLNLPDGFAAAPAVVAVYQRGSGFGDVTLAHEDVFAHSSRQLDQQILVRARPGTDLASLSAKYPGLTVSAKAGLSDEQRNAATASALSSALPLVLVFAYIALAVANTLVMTTLARTREFALLRLVGMTRDQVLKVLRIEALTVVLIAVAAGSAVPLIPLATVSLGLTGSPVPSIPPLLYLGIVAATALVGAASVLVPAKFALRARPADAIGTRE